MKEFLGNSVNIALVEMESGEYRANAELVFLVSEPTYTVSSAGEMIRQRGIANGRQVVPAWWIDDINTRGDAQAWARSELAEMFPQASYRSQWYRIDRDKGVLVAFGIHGQWIYIHPDAELVIIRMASEATPLDPDRVRGWRRGFDAIAARFL